MKLQKFELDFVLNCTFCLPIKMQLHASEAD